jgi:hypothetical protein
MAGPVGAAAVVVVCIAIVMLLASPVGAQEPTAIELSLTDAAAVFGAAERVPGLEAEVAALRAENDALKAQLARLEKLVALDEQIIAKEQALRGLAEQERDAHQERAERVVKDGKRGALGLRVQARAGAGALLGVAVAPLFPPAALIGPALGAAIGLIEHWIVD